MVFWIYSLLEAQWFYLREVSNVLLGRYRFLSLSVLTILVGLVWANPVYSQERCVRLFRDLSQAEQVDFAIKQWRRWEILPTVDGWAQVRAVSPIPISKVRSDSVEIQISSALDVVGLEQLLNPNDGQFYWFKHPYNTDYTVPNFYETVIATIDGYHTASRTMEITWGGRRIGIKMATNKPFGESGIGQPEKSELNKDLRYAVARSKLIGAIDLEIGLNPKLKIQKEIAAIVDKKTGNGILLRDYSDLEDGFFYLPAHLIPYVGKDIAHFADAKFIRFWGRHWAASIGILQAQLLIRYGLQVRSVNPQNFLIQLDQNLRPTGVVVWRDIAESKFVKPVAEVIPQAYGFMNSDARFGKWSIDEGVSIETYNLSWNFNAKTEIVTDTELAGWIALHNEAYVRDLEKNLKIKIPRSDVWVGKFINDDIGSGYENSIILKGIVGWHHRSRSKKDSR